MRTGRKKAEEARPLLLSGVRKKGEAGSSAFSPEALALLADSIACLALATGAAMALFAATVMEGGFFLCLGLALACMLALAVLRLRWWIAPLVLGAAALGTAGLHLWRRDLGVWLAERAAYWSGFAAWLSEGAPEHMRYSGDGSLLALQLAIVFALCLALFLFIRRFFLYQAAVLLFGGLFLLLFRQGWGDPAPGMCVCMAGLIILLPRLYHRALVKQNPEDAGVARGPMQMMAVPVAVIAVAGAMLLTGEDTSAWRSRALVNLVDDVAYLLEGPFARRGYGGFRLSGVGYMPLGDRLGGPAELEDALAFTLRTQGQPFLLKGSAEDLYTGDNWLDSRSDGDFRLGSLFWRGYRTAAFDLDRPLGGRKARELYGQLTVPVDYQLQYERSYAVVFAGGQIEKIEAESGSIDLQVYFNGQGEVYSHYRFPRRERVEVHTRMFRREHPDFDRDMLVLEALAGAQEDSRWEEIARRYLQLPEGYSPAVREAAALAAGEGTPYERARAIEGWLGENLAYTLSPEVPPEDVDFVEHFLASGEGYCTYFASAMAVMARCQGIPARYVTGFGLRAGRTPGSYEATGRTAHAWAELYFSGVGWVPFDPLAWDPFAEEEEWENAAGGAVLPREEERVGELPPHGEAEGEGALAAAASLPRTVPVFGLAALLLWLGWRWAKRRLLALPRRRYLPERVLRKAGTPAAAFDRYYADILRQLALLGVEVSPGETLTALARRVDRIVREEQYQDRRGGSPGAGGSMTAVCVLRMKLHYGGVLPTERDLRDTWEYHSMLENLVRRRLGDGRYMLRRVMRP